MQVDLKTLFLAWLLHEKIKKMTTKEIHTSYKQIVKSLDKRELNLAFDSLEKLATTSQTYMFSDEVRNLQETYKRLLHYYIEGSKDPMQAKVYSDLLASTYELTDKITQQLLIVDSPEIYYSEQRMRNILTESISQLIDTTCSAYDINNISSATTAVTKLFKRIWTSAFLSDEDMTALNNSLVPKNLESNITSKHDYMTVLNCQIVSALMLGLQKKFDKRKIYLLISAAESNDEEVKIRAYTGILITLYFYKHRIGCYPEVIHRLDNLAESADFRKIIYTIILRFILSRETEKISNKMKDEIIPEMMKLNPKFNPHTPLKDSPPENLENEMNPEWMEKISNSPLGKKIEELNKQIGRAHV